MVTYGADMKDEPNEANGGVMEGKGWFWTVREGK